MQPATKEPNKWQKFILIILLVLAGLILTIIFTMPSGNKKSTSSKPKTVKVKKISMKQTLLLSGVVQSSKSVNVISKINGTLERVFVKNGQYVKKGDLIAKIDDSQANYKLEALKRQLLELELQKENLQKQIQNFTVKSPEDGFVQNLNINEGLFLSQGMQIMTIVDDSKMKLSVQLPAWCYNEIKKGQKAEVILTELMDKLDGVIDFVSDRIYRNQDGIMVFDVKIVVPNVKGTLAEGMKANARLKLLSGQEVAAVAEGVLEAFSKENVVSSVSGKVEKIYLLRTGRE